MICRNPRERARHTRATRRRRTVEDDEEDDDEEDEEEEDAEEEAAETEDDIGGGAYAKTAITPPWASSTSVLSPTLSAPAECGGAWA